MWKSWHALQDVKHAVEQSEFATNLASNQENKCAVFTTSQLEYRHMLGN
jgi:hypothetical protein